MNKRKLKFTIIGLIIIFLLSFIWLNDTLTEEFLASKYLNERTDPIDVATAFAFALRLNHPMAYEISDPALWPRLDRWMETNKLRECEWRGIFGEFVTVSSGEFEYSHNFFCNYTFDATDIVVRDNRVVNWDVAYYFRSR